ncbi:putative UMP kinase transcription factor Trihelix family [Helianthus annuus]|nr:putative UMP kinase transcription factor Trihelix family [Helianthus annuus]
MASSDDDFPLITATTADTTTTGHQSNPNFHRHQLAATAHLLSSQTNQITARPPAEATGEAYGDGAYCSQQITVAVPYENDSDPTRSRINGARNDKWNDREELSDGGTPYNYKKPKVSGSNSAGEYRKDREEWSDTAIACLLDAYLDKFVQLNRGNLRGRDWEEVAVSVSERCEKQTKSVEQCKNKVDNLKKRYKLERHRMMNTVNANGGNVTSHWPWFKKMEQIVGNSLPLKTVLGEENSGSGMSSPGRQSNKRYATATSSPSCQIATIKAKPVANARWRRVVFKISGASLAGTGSHSADPKVAMLIAREVSMACNVGVEVAIVVGGRNFFCGDTWVTSTGMDRSTAYQIGMMATVMNSMLIQSALEKLGVQTRVQSAFSMPEVFEPYSKQRAIRHLEKGRVVIFGGIGAGTGNPLFSTDTAAALRASEINADVFIKGTNADGVYECDSMNNVAFEHISFRELASRGASPMDMMAATFCEENGIPVVIFNLHEPGNISRALSGEHVGTLIDQTGRID